MTPRLDIKNSGNMRAVVMSLALIAVCAAAWGCGGGAPDPVPKGATPEDVVRIWFEVVEKREVKKMPGLFDPDSPLHQQAKAVMLPPVSMSNLILETRLLTDHQAEVIADFDAILGMPPEAGKGQKASVQTHSKTRFTLIRKEDGKWRLTGIRPADEGLGLGPSSP